MLEDAVEYDLIARNPAAGKRRRLQASKPQRTYLDQADHIAAPLDAAAGLAGADGFRLSVQPAKDATHED